MGQISQIRLMGRMRQIFRAFVCQREVKPWSGKILRNCFKRRHPDDVRN